MTDTVIQIENLGKRYRVGGQFQLDRTLPEAISQACKRMFDKLRGHTAKPCESSESTESTTNAAALSNDFWALDDINFSVNRGEVVGIIGHNGAGKSTLLKILSEITEPTTGRAVIKGRVASLLEVGTGFHPELTGRENIYLNGSILGMPRKEIKEKFDQIVAFSGIERFLDTPVKRYSSGMTVRLAFAVAAHLDPEILIIDEVLAVGDAEFQRRCLGKMQDVADSGRTVLFVSHNLGAVQSLCNRAILLKGGKVQADGEPHEVVRQYLHAAAEQRDSALADRTDREGDGNGKLLVCDVRAQSSDDGDVVQVGSPWQMDVEFDRKVDGESYGIQIGVFSGDGTRVAFMHTDQHEGLDCNWPTAGRLRLKMDDACLLWPGAYTVNLALLIDGRVVDFVRNAAAFEAVLAPELKSKLPGRYTSTMFLPARPEMTDLSGNLVIDEVTGREAA